MERDRSPSLYPPPTALAGVHLEERRGAVTARPACPPLRRHSGPGKPPQGPGAAGRGWRVPDPARSGAGPGASGSAGAQLSHRGALRHDSQLPCCAPPPPAKSLQNNTIYASPRPEKAALKHQTIFSGILLIPLLPHSCLDFIPLLQH